MIIACILCCYINEQEKTMKKLIFSVLYLLAFNVSAAPIYEYEVWIQAKSSLDTNDITVAGRIVNTGTVTLDLTAQWGYLGGFPSLGCGLECVHNQLNGLTLDAGQSIDFFWMNETHSEDWSSYAGAQTYGGLGLIPLGSDWQFNESKLSYLAYGELVNGAVDSTIFNKVTINLDIAGSSITGTPLSSIPIPSAVWLFGSGLISLIGVARRKKI